MKILRDKLTADGVDDLAKKLVISDEQKSSIIGDCKKQFPEDASVTDQLHEDLAVFACALFLEKNFALIINRYFTDFWIDEMKDVADIIKIADFSLINPPIITFIYRNALTTRHFFQKPVEILSNRG